MALPIVGPWQRAPWVGHGSLMPIDYVSHTHIGQRHGTIRHGINHRVLSCGHGSAGWIMPLYPIATAMPLYPITAAIPRPNRLDRRSARCLAPPFWQRYTTAPRLIPSTVDPLSTAPCAIPSIAHDTIASTQRSWTYRYV